MTMRRHYFASELKDKELAAMEICLKVFDQLDDSDSRWRVLRFLRGRYEGPEKAQSWEDAKMGLEPRIPLNGR